MRRFSPHMFVRRPWTPLGSSILVQPGVSALQPLIHRSLHTSVTTSTATSPLPLESAPQPPPPAPPKGPFSQLSVYGELCKARLSSLVVITSGAGFLLAGHPVDWVSLLAAVSGTALAAAAANTFNQILESPLDALMKRTQGRPLPTGRLTRPAAMAFGVGATLASAGVLYLGTNPLTLALGMGNIALYACVYTPLKQVTTLNTAVGAVVGAIPPLMGWAAATGSLAAVDPYLLAYILFAWQFPHFYALAWPLRKDYARGGYAMVPCFDATGARTATLITRHTLALSTIPIVSALLGVTSPMFAVEGLALNAYFLSLTRAFKADPTDANARAIFRASLWYLPLLLTLFVFHANHWLAKEEEVKLNTLVGPPPKSSAWEGERGVTWGEAVENCIGTARLVGRELCIHELISWGGGGAGGKAVEEVSPAASACPVVVARDAPGVISSAIHTSQQQQQQQQQEQQQQQQQKE